MTKIFKKAQDNLANGAIFGAAVGVLVVYGQKVYEWLVPLIPEAATTFAGDFSIPIMVIGAFALTGYLLDRY